MKNLFLLPIIGICAALMSCGDASETTISYDDDSAYEISEGNEEFGTKVDVKVDISKIPPEIEATREAFMELCIPFSTEEEEPIPYCECGFNHMATAGLTREEFDDGIELFTGEFTSGIDSDRGVNLANELMYNCSPL